MKFIVFALGEEKYGLGISAVREIVKWDKITKLPQMNDRVMGIFKLRDQIIPIISLRRQFGLPELANIENSEIIIVEKDNLLVGICVDNVEEVVNVSDDMIEPATKISNIKSDIIYGIAKFDDYLLILIDTKFLFAEGVVESLNS